MLRWSSPNVWAAALLPGSAVDKPRGPWMRIEASGAFAQYRSFPCSFLRRLSPFEGRSIVDQTWTDDSQMPDRSTVLQCLERAEAIHGAEVAGLLADPVADALTRSANQGPIRLCWRVVGCGLQRYLRPQVGDRDRPVVPIQPSGRRPGGRHGPRRGRRRAAPTTGNLRFRPPSWPGNCLGPADISASSRRGVSRSDTSGGTVLVLPAVALMLIARRCSRPSHLSA